MEHQNEEIEQLLRIIDAKDKEIEQLKKQCDMWYTKYCRSEEKYEKRFIYISGRRG